MANDYLGRVFDTRESSVGSIRLVGYDSDRSTLHFVGLFTGARYDCDLHAFVRLVRRDRIVEQGSRFDTLSLPHKILRLINLVQVA